MLDTLEGVGRHNTEREELQQSNASGVESVIDVDKHGDEDDDVEATAGRKTAGDWLAIASSMAEETLVSHGKHQMVVSPQNIEFSWANAAPRPNQRVCKSRFL